jgi:hypothetical protein
LAERRDEQREQGEKCSEQFGQAAFGDFHGCLWRVSVLTVVVLTFLLKIVFNDWQRSCRGRPSGFVLRLIAVLQFSPFFPNFGFALDIWAVPAQGSL